MLGQYEGNSKEEVLEQLYLKYGVNYLHHFNAFTVEEGVAVEAEDSCDCPICTAEADETKRKPRRRPRGKAKEKGKHEEKEDLH